MNSINQYLLNLYILRHAQFSRQPIDRVIWLAHSSDFSTDVDILGWSSDVALVVKFGKVNADWGMISGMNYTIWCRAVEKIK